MCGEVGGAIALSEDMGGMADIEVPPADFNFAEDEGTGSQLWAGVGFAGSRGGAFRLFFGTDDAGCEWSTSAYLRY